MLWTCHSGRAARLRESRADAGMVAVLRTEAQRTAVWDDRAERPRGWPCGMAVQGGPENGCVGQLCKEAQRMAVWAKRPRGRAHLACRLTLSEQDSSD